MANSAGIVLDASTLLPGNANQIHCQTQNAAPSLIISATGVDPTYGIGFAWSPQYATVQQGAIVQWQWGSSALLTTLSYKVQQTANGYTTTSLSGGFDSGSGSASGKKILIEIINYNNIYFRIFFISISKCWNILLLDTRC